MTANSYLWLSVWAVIAGGVAGSLFSLLAGVFVLALMDRRIEKMKVKTLKKRAFFRGATIFIIDPPPIDWAALLNAKKQKDTPKKFLPAQALRRQCVEV